MNHKFHIITRLLLYLMLNGLLFAIPFLYSKVFFLIFIAFVPIAWVVGRLNRIWQQLLYTFILVLTWHSLTISWFVSDETPFWAGALMILLASIVKFSPFLIYFSLINRLKLNTTYKYFFFCCLWIAVEWLSFEWELAFPFLSLGFSLGDVPMLIRWYQYAGALGGTLWILLVNAIIIMAVAKTSKRRKLYLCVSLVLLPLLVSSCLHFFDSPSAKSQEVRVYVANVNDVEANRLYCGELSFDDFLKSSSNGIDSSAFLIVYPEGLCHLPPAAFPYNTYFSSIKRMLKKQAPHSSLVFGASTQAIKMIPDIGSNDFYNMAIQCDTSGFVAFRNKMRLVPFGEFIPYKTVCGLIPQVEIMVKKSLVNTQTYDRCFTTNGIQILPLVCYELYFGGDIASYIRRKKADIIVSLSNDYALKKPIFAQQLIRMARVQAISFDRYVLKSSINGKSVIISPQGKIVSESGYNTNELLSANIYANSRITLYGKYGDKLILLFLLAVFLIVHAISYHEKKNSHTPSYAD